MVERDQAAKWFGPERFTVPFIEIEAKEGGSYRMCMREPDGTDNIVTGALKQKTAWTVIIKVGPVPSKASANI